MKNLIDKINEILLNYSKGNKKIAYNNLKKISLKYPDNEKIQFNLAIMEQDQGMIIKSKTSYKKLIDKYNNTNAKIKLYLLYLKEQNYLSALEIINLILNEDDSNYSVILDKAYIYFKSNQINDCKRICYKVIKEDPKNLKAINLIGRCLLDEKKYEDAKIILLKGISYDKNNIAILNSLGKLYFDLWNIEDSEKYFFNALEQNPKSYQTLNNLAGLYLETNRSEKAIKYYLQALDVLPNEPTILNNIAKTYLSLNNIDEAEKYCLLALKIKNEDSFKKILSIIYFRKMDFKNGWKYFDGRLGLNDFVRRNESYNSIKKKLLNNKKIDANKNLLIIREQGVGDEILYGTIYKDLLNKYDKVTIETDERLIPLFKNSFDQKHHNKFVKLGTFSNNSKKIDKFVQILYAGSLGYYFRNKIENFSKENYLKITQNQINKGRLKLKICKKKYKIGLSWKSFNNIYSNQKSLKLTDLDKLINSDNLDFINLQYGDVNNEVENFNKSSKSKIHLLSNIDLFNDFIMIGSILKNIDLFITVSNSTAHLAGALGVKTLLIKPFNQATFHYWNQANNKTTWYKSIELIERNEIKNIKSFLNKVMSKLN